MRDSLWFLPSLLTLAGAGLAMAMIYVDERVESGPLDWVWVFGGGPESALSILSSIVTSLITVTGVTFSVTIVALQLASSQYTPRVLRNFTADRGNQLVLGVFIATFTYALLIQRRVRIENEAIDPFVPSLSVTLAVALVLVSVGFLIYFVDHMARSIQAPVIIDRATREALALVDRLFPEPIGEPARETPHRAPAEQPAVVAARRGGYLQAVDENALFELANGSTLTLQMEARIGEFLLPRQALASAWPAERIGEEEEHRVREAFVLGIERVPQQDVEFGILEVVDIAVRSLSPSLNDPETAMNSVDRLGEILAVLGQRDFPTDIRTDEGGRVRFIARRLEYGEAVAAAFEPIRHFGAAHPRVAARVIDTLRKVMEVVPEYRHPPLVREIEVMLESARGAVHAPGELDLVERAATAALPSRRAA